MNRTIKSAVKGYLEESGKLVRSLVKEIRSKRFYLPELDLVMVDEHNRVIGKEKKNERIDIDGKSQTSREYCGIV